MYQVRAPDHAHHRQNSHSNLMKKKCRVVKVKKAAFATVVGDEVVLECVPHRVYFGADLNSKRPVICPIPEIIR